MGREKIMENMFYNRDYSIDEKIPVIFQFQEETWLVSAEEIRQYFYCKRIPYLRHIRKIRPKMTFLMKKGTEFHEKIKNNKRLIRKMVDMRSRHEGLRLNKNGGSGIGESDNGMAEYYFDQFISNPGIHLMGQLDIFEVRYEHENCGNKCNDKREYIPIEIKFTDLKSGGKSNHIYQGARLHHITQLTAQAILLECEYDTIVSEARVIYIDEISQKFSKMESIEITIDMKHAILKAIDEIGESYFLEAIPETMASMNRAKCKGCEYWRFCMCV